MNRSAVIMLLNRRRVLWDLPKASLTDDVIDEWARSLATVDEQEAFTALDYLARQDGRVPSLVNVRARTATPTPIEPGQLGKADCEVCAGTGWMTVREDVDRQAPCYLCRPDHPWHKRRARLHPEPQKVIVMEGAEERLAAWRRSKDEYATLLRQQFPNRGKIVDDATLRERMAAIPRHPAWPEKRPSTGVTDASTGDTQDGE